MGLIADSMGAGLGQGLAQWGAMLDRDYNSSDKLELMRQQNDSKLQVALATLQAKIEAGGKKGDPFETMFADEVKNAGGVTKALGLDLNPTSKDAFMKDVPPLTPNDDEGNPMPPSGLKEFDKKGYDSAEDARVRKIERGRILMSDDPSKLKGYEEGKAQDIANAVAEAALKNPKLSVGELADRLSLLKPGEDRINASGGVVYNRAGVGGEDNDGIIAAYQNGRGGADDESKARRLTISQDMNSLNKTEDELIKQIKTQIEQKAKVNSKEQPAINSAIADLNAQLADIRKQKEMLRQEQRKLGGYGGGAAGPAATTIAPATRPPANAAGVRSVLQGVLGSN